MMHIVPCVIVPKWNDASNVVPFRLSFKDKQEFISFFFFSEASWMLSSDNIIIWSSAMIIISQIHIETRDDVF